jgi:hypothetical protein
MLQQQPGRTSSNASINVSRSLIQGKRQTNSRTKGIGWQLMQSLTVTDPELDGFSLERHRQDASLPQLARLNSVFCWTVFHHPVRTGYVEAEPKNN